MHNFSYANEFYLHENKNSFEYERPCTKTRFENEARRLENGQFLLLIIFTIYADNQQTVKSKAGQIPPIQSAGTWFLEPVEQDFFCLVPMRFFFDAGFWRGARGHAKAL